MTAFDKWCNELSDKDKIGLICIFYDDSSCANCPLDKMKDCMEVSNNDVQDFLHKKLDKNTLRINGTIC